MNTDTSREHQPVGAHGSASIGSEESGALPCAPTMLSAGDGQAARLSVIHPTLGRPAQCIETAEEWMRFAAEPSSVEYIFGVEPSDTDTMAAVLAFSERWPMVKIAKLSRDGVGYVASVNAAASISEGDVLVMVEDDMHPCIDWDRRVIESITRVVQGFSSQCSEPNTDKVPFAAEHRTLNTSHLPPLVLFVRNRLNPKSRYGHQVLTRARYIDQGSVVFFPGYFSMYADTDFWARSARDKVLHYADGFMFEHRHPILGNLHHLVPWDKTYNIENDPDHYRNGRILFTERNPEMIA